MRLGQEIMFEQKVERQCVGDCLCSEDRASVGPALQENIDHGMQEG